MPDNKEKIRVPLIKIDEKTWGGRIYTRSSIIRALEKIKWDSSLPLVGEDRHKNRKEYSFLRKTDLEFNDSEGILYVFIDPDLKGRLFGLSLAPYVHVDYVRRDKEVAYIEEFTLNGVQVTSDLCAFSSIESKIQ